MLRKKQLSGQFVADWISICLVKFIKWSCQYIFSLCYNEKSVQQLSLAKKSVLQDWPVNYTPLAEWCMHWKVFIFVVFFSTPHLVGNTIFLFRPTFCLRFFGALFTCWLNIWTKRPRCYQGLTYHSVKCSFNANIWNTGRN